MLVFLIAAVVLIDLAAKDVIEHTEDRVFPRPLSRTDGLVSLRKVHNPGLPFGRLAGHPGLVKGIPLAVTSAATGIFCLLFPKKGYGARKFGLALVIGGGLSNLYDRLFRGYVVDYLHIGWKKLKGVIFNLADVCILIGSAVFFAGELIASFRE